MKRTQSHGIKVQLAFVIRGKAYFTLRTATQAVARQIVSNVEMGLYRRRTWQELQKKRGDHYYHYAWHQQMNKRAYKRVKPIVQKIFPSQEKPIVY
jgi:hypothetical protein